MNSTTFKDWYRSIKQMPAETPVVQMCKTPEAFLSFVEQAKVTNRDIIVSPLLFSMLPKWETVTARFEPTTKIEAVRKGVIGKCDTVTVYTDAHWPINKRTMQWTGDFPMLALI